MLKTGRELLEYLQGLSKEDLDKEIMVYDGEWTYSNLTVGSVDFTEDGMVEEDYANANGSVLVIEPSVE